MRKNQKGFITIVVPMIIATLGLFSSVILLSLNSARIKARDAKRVADVRQLASALELAYNDTGTYPAQLSALTPNYISQLPIAPTPVDGNCSITDNNYSYSSSGKGTSSNYELKFCLGGETAGYAPGVHTMDWHGIK